MKSEILGQSSENDLASYFQVQLQNETLIRYETITLTTIIIITIIITIITIIITIITITSSLSLPDHYSIQYQY